MDAPGHNDGGIIGGGQMQHTVTVGAVGDRGDAADGGADGSGGSGGAAGLDPFETKGSATTTQPSSRSSGKKWRWLSCWCADLGEWLVKLILACGAGTAVLIGAVLVEPARRGLSAAAKRSAVR